MSTEISSWSQLSTEQLEEYRRRLLRQIDAGRDVEQKQRWMAEIEAILESRKSAS